MSISRADFRKELKLYLKDSAAKFSPEELNSHLDIAASDLSRVKPLVIPDELTLVADTANYAAPSDMLQPLYLQWSENIMRGLQPWDDNYPGRLPILSAVSVSGSRMIQLTPPPSATQISVLGATAGYLYSAKYVIDDSADNTTVPDTLRPLLLIRAAASALQSLALNGSAKPVNMGGQAGISLPKNGTPQALAEQLMELFERIAA